MKVKAQDVPVDMGANIPVVNSRVWEQLPPSDRLMLEGVDVTIVLATGSPAPFLGHGTFNLRVGDQQTEHTTWVADIQPDRILRLDSMRSNCCQLIRGDDSFWLTVGDGEREPHLTEPSVCCVAIDQTTVLRAGGQADVPARLVDGGFIEELGLLEAAPRLVATHKVLLAKTKTLIHAFVTSRIDNCNALLYGLPSYLVQRLQYVLNSAARLIFLSRKADHITPLLIDLHWLPVEQRINFKIMLLTYKIINDLAPSYLSNLLVPYVPRRALGSADKLLLSQPSYRLKSYGFRAFSICAPSLWNKLPINIECSQSVATFKRNLKTYLFRLAHY